MSKGLGLLLVLSIGSLAELRNCGKQASPTDAYTDFADRAKDGDCKALYDALDTPSQARLVAQLEVMASLARAAHERQQAERARDAAEVASKPEAESPAEPGAGDTPKNALPTGRAALEGLHGETFGNPGSAPVADDREDREALKERLLARYKDKREQARKRKARELLAKLRGKSLFLMLCGDDPPPLPTLFRERGPSAFSAHEIVSESIKDDVATLTVGDPEGEGEDKNSEQGKQEMSLDEPEGAQEDDSTGTPEGAVSDAGAGDATSGGEGVGESEEGVPAGEPAGDDARDERSDEQLKDPEEAAASQAKAEPSEPPTIELRKEGDAWKLSLQDIHVRWERRDDARWLPSLDTPMLRVTVETDLSRTPTQAYERIREFVRSKDCEAFYQHLSAATRARLERYSPMMLGLAQALGGGVTIPRGSGGKALIVSLCERAPGEGDSFVGITLADVREERIEGSVATLTLATPKPPRRDDEDDEPAWRKRARKPKRKPKPPPPITLVREEGRWKLRIDIFENRALLDPSGPGVPGPDAPPGAGPAAGDPSGPPDRAATGKPRKRKRAARGKRDES